MAGVPSRVFPLNKKLHRKDPRPVLVEDRLREAMILDIAAVLRGVRQRRTRCMEQPLDLGFFGDGTLFH